MVSVGQCQEGSGEYEFGQIKTDNISVLTVNPKHASCACHSAAERQLSLQVFLTAFADWFRYNRLWREQMQSVFSSRQQ